MINTEGLVKRPLRDLLPVATDAEAIDYFTGQMEAIKREIMLPIRLAHLRHSKDLLHVSGAEKYSLIAWGTDKRRDRSLPRLKIERKNAQDLLFGVMKKYGFDETKTYGDSDTSVRSDGITREVILYPSQTIKGLSFRRVRDFVTDQPEDTTNFWWQVVDQGGAFKVDVKNALCRPPKASN